MINLEAKKAQFHFRFLDSFNIDSIFVKPNGSYVINLQKNLYIKVNKLDNWDTEEDSLIFINTRMYYEKLLSFEPDDQLFFDFGKKENDEVDKSRFVFGKERLYYDIHLGDPIFEEPLREEDIIDLIETDYTDFRPFNNLDLNLLLQFIYSIDTVSNLWLALNEEDVKQLLLTADHTITHDKGILIFDQSSTESPIFDADQIPKPIKLNSSDFIKFVKLIVPIPAEYKRLFDNDMDITYELGLEQPILKLNFGNNFEVFLKGNNFGVTA